LEKPIPDPTLDGSMTDKKKITSDELHWDNTNLIIDMSQGNVDIDLKSK
jgi:hypothetical protein